MSFELTLARSMHLPNLRQLTLSGNRNNDGVPYCHPVEYELLSLLTNIVTATIEAPLSPPFLPLLQALKYKCGPQAIALPLLALPTLQEASFEDEDSDQSIVMANGDWPEGLPKSKMKRFWTKQHYDYKELRRDIGAHMRGPCILKADSTLKSDHRLRLWIPYEDAPEDEWLEGAEAEKGQCVY